MAKETKAVKPELRFVKSLSIAILGAADKGEIKVAGTIAKASPKTGKFGDYTQFTGNFQARVGEEYFSAPKMYVPSSCEGYFEGREGTKVVFSIEKTKGKDGKNVYSFKPISGFGDVGSIDEALTLS